MKNRMEAFQRGLKGDGALIENPVDLFYLTGLQLSKGTLTATKNEAALFVDGRYFAAAEKKAPCPVLKLESGAPMKWLAERKAAKVEFDSAFVSYEGFEALKKESGAVVLSPRSRLLKMERGIKSQEEMGALKRAAQLTYRGYEHIAGALREGVAEEELAWEFEVFVRTHGGTGLSFEPIIAFGENSAYPHHRAGKTKLKRGESVLIDVGAIVDSYRGDLTRVHFFGKVDQELEKMLHWTKRAQQAAIEKIRPGARLGDLDLAARQVFKEAGVEGLFTHGLGHGIGLETHEFPSVRTGGLDQDLILETGMVFTVEPGLYKTGLGGVRWEDVVQVVESGVEKLT